MKHLDVKHMWLQELSGKGIFVTKKIPRTENFSDMLTHIPSAVEFKKFLPLIGMFPLEFSLDPLKHVKAKLVEGSGFGLSAKQTEIAFFDL